MRSKRYASVKQENCTACGECVYECPRGAIAIRNGCFAVVDKDICVGCGICSRHCPAGCITMMERQVSTIEE